MDQFLASHGTQPILKPGTAESLNRGKIVVDTKWNNIPLIYTPVCRVAACTLDRPRAAPAIAGQPPGREKYFARFLLHPHGCSELVEAIMALATARWQPLNLGDRVVSVMERFTMPKERGGIHYPLTLGDFKYQQDPVKNIDYQGVVVLNATMDKETKGGVPLRPIIKDKRGMVADPGLIFPGCYVIAAIKLASYDHPTGGPGITAYLHTIQFVAPGPRMVSGYDASTATSDLGESPDYGVPEGFAAAPAGTPTSQPQPQSGQQPPPGYPVQPSSPWQPPPQGQWQPPAQLPPGQPPAGPAGYSGTPVPGPYYPGAPTAAPPGWQPPPR